MLIKHIIFNALTSNNFLFRSFRHLLFKTQLNYQAHQQKKTRKSKKKTVCDV